MSLNVRKGGTVIYVYYTDNERSGEVIIDLKEDKAIISSCRNLRVIFESIPTGFEEQLLKRKKKAEVIANERRTSLKKEILKLLTSYRAFDPNSALSLDDIIEIAQYQKDLYPKINEVIETFSRPSLAKKMLALIVGSLRKSGQLMKTEVTIGNEVVLKYYLSKRAK